MNSFKWPSYSLHRVSCDWAWKWEKVEEITLFSFMGYQIPNPATFVLRITKEREWIVFSVFETTNYCSSLFPKRNLPGPWILMESLMVAANRVVVLFSLRGPLTPDYQLFVLPSYRNNRTSACVTVQQLCRMGWLTEARWLCIVFWSPSIASHWVFSTEAKLRKTACPLKCFRLFQLTFPCHIDVSHLWR